MTATQELTMPQAPRLDPSHGVPSFETPFWREMPVKSVSLLTRLRRRVRLSPVFGILALGIAAGVALFAVAAVTLAVLGGLYGQQIAGIMKPLGL